MKVDPNQVASMQIGTVSGYQQGQFPSDAEVNDIQFMTPAKVSYSVEGEEEQEVIVFVDLLRKKAYSALGEIEPEFAAKLFECLSVSTHMPDDMFEADQETYDKIDEVQRRHDEIYGDHLKGEDNE